MPEPSFEFGMIGLGVMGRNLLLNMADHGFPVTGYDLDPAKISALESSATPGTTAKGSTSLQAMMQSLKPPRRVMMLVPAGNPVDAVLADLVPLLEPGDIVIDGGNSHYTDTLRRVKQLQDKSIHFMGMGISGGESGARTGPSIMPGGDPKAWQAVKPILEAVAAQVGGSPCVAYMGRGAAGHYVKMVHNGIEYAIMQLISETYLLLHQGGGLDNDRLSKIYSGWNQGPLKSFLLEITAEIFQKQDDLGTGRLVDRVSDKAGSKGTGKWTSQDAMDLPIPLQVIDTAVSMRDLSGFKDQRQKAAALYPHKGEKIQTNSEWLEAMRQAFLFSTVISYAQGLSMLQVASRELGMDIPLQDVVRIWRGGCIIRSELLDQFYPLFQKDPSLENILLTQEIAKLLKEPEDALRNLVRTAATAGYPVGGMMASLSYFDAFRLDPMPTNLIQAQRDYFGAHTYQRTDRPGTFHSQWDPN